LLRKEIYLSFLLSILLLLSIDISFYNHVVLGKQDSKEDGGDDNERSEDEAEDFEDTSLKELFDDNGDSKDGGGNDNERSGDEAEDFDDISINELFGDNNDNSNKEENDEENDTPFILPFKAVPFQ